MSINCPYCHEEVPYSEYISHMEQEHPAVVGKELARTTTDQKPQNPIDWNKPGGTARLLERYGPKETHLPQHVGTPHITAIYLTVLDRFKDEEEKGIRQYETLLSQITHSLQVSPEEEHVILIELQRKINRILQEEKTHLEAINSLKEMLK